MSVAERKFHRDAAASKNKKKKERSTRVTDALAPVFRNNNMSNDRLAIPNYRWRFSTKERKKKNREETNEKGTKRRIAPSVYVSCIVRKHTYIVVASVATVVTRCNACLLVSPSLTPSHHVYLYVSTVYEYIITPWVLCASPVVAAAHATTICHSKLPSSSANCKIIK